MSLFGLKEKKEIERLRATLSPEQVELADLQGALEEARKALAIVTAQREQEVQKLDALRAQLVQTEEELNLQSFGVYKPRYDLMRADDYRARLMEIRAQQKEMIKAKTAVTGVTNWTVNNNAAQGRKMVSDMQKLLLRAFNSECDDVIEHVRYSNLEASEKRITSSKDAISKLGTIMGISITPAYYRLKIEELYLAFEYQQKKQAEKEEQKEARARMREEAKLAKEIEEERKNWRRSSGTTRTPSTKSTPSWPALRKPTGQTSSRKGRSWCSNSKNRPSLQRRGLSRGQPARRLCVCDFQYRRLWRERIQNRHDPPPRPHGASGRAGRRLCALRLRCSRHDFLRRCPQAGSRTAQRLCGSKAEFRQPAP